MRMDSPFPEMYGCPEHWQSEAIFEAFVDVSGLVLNVAAWCQWGHVQQLTAVEVYTYIRGVWTKLEVPGG